MTPERFHGLVKRYASLRVAVVGDFCLDRYLEIDPAREEISIETGLPVHQVMRVRAQAGAAGTVLNNLVALGVGSLPIVGFCGDDGEGYELERGLGSLPGVEMEHFRRTPERRTFTYCKPLLVSPGRPPRELSRLDSKNHSPTPPELAADLAQRVLELAPRLDGIVVMEQVDTRETGVINAPMHQALARVARDFPTLPIVADSRLGLGAYPPVCCKMNLAELRLLLAEPELEGEAEIGEGVRALARQRGRPVFVTMAERGIFGAGPDGTLEHVPAFPVLSEIDVVGAGDSVTANLCAALAAGATLREAMQLAMAAANLVVHQLGTTGTAGVNQIGRLVLGESPSAAGKA